MKVPFVIYADTASLLEKNTDYHDTEKPSQPKWKAISHMVIYYLHNINYILIEINMIITDLRNFWKIAL